MKAAQFRASSWITHLLILVTWIDFNLVFSLMLLKNKQTKTKNPLEKNIFLHTHISDLMVKAKVKLNNFQCHNSQGICRQETVSSIGTSMACSSLKCGSLKLAFCSVHRLWYRDKHALQFIISRFMYPMCKNMPPFPQIWSDLICHERIVCTVLVFSLSRYRLATAHHFVSIISLTTFFFFIYGVFTTNIYYGFSVEFIIITGLELSIHHWMCVYLTTNANR